MPSLCVTLTLLALSLGQAPAAPVPGKAAPADLPAAKQAPTKEAPTKEAPTKQAPTKEAPTDAPATKKAETKADTGPTAPPTKTASTPIWQLQPFDRIELYNREIHDIDPERIPAGFKFDIKPGEYCGRPGLPPLNEIVRAVLYKIRLQEDGQEYYVYGRSVRAIWVYEEMLLEEARRLLRQGQADEAYECIRTVQARSPDWPTLEEARIAYHRNEAELLSIQLNWPRAFASLLEEYHLRDLRGRRISQSISQQELEPDLKERLDKVADSWLKMELSRKRYDSGRRVVASLEAVYPESPVAAKFRAEYARQADALLAEMTEREKAGSVHDAFVKLLEAIELYPDSPKVRAAADRHYQAYRPLRVAVEQLPSYRTGPRGWSPADWRDSELLNLPIMRWSEQDRGGSFQSQVVESLDQAEINRQATLTLKQGLRWPGDNKPVTVVDLHRLLADMCRPSSAYYHPALGRLILNMRPEMPDQLTIDFARPQFQPAAWLQIPFLRAGLTSADSLSWSVVGSSGLGPFQLAELDDTHAYFSVNPVYLEAGKPLIREVMETKYATSPDRLRALRDREVDLIASIPPRHLDDIASIPGARLVKLSLPKMHVLQFNLNRRELQRRTLRRAIDYAINREAIFAAVGMPIDRDNRIVTGPMPYGALGYDPQIVPRSYDPQLARALIFAVRKEVKAIPPLTLSHSGDETSRIACQKIVEYCNAAGLQVRLVENDGSAAFDPLDADIRYQTYTVTEPVYDVVTLLTRDNPSLAQKASPWFRQLIVELIQAPNSASSRAILPKLHRAIFDEVAVLPLWQWSEHFAVSDSVSGIADPAPTLFHRVVDWAVKPVYPDSHWATKAEPKS